MVIEAEPEPEPDDDLPAVVESRDRDLPDPYSYDFDNCKLEPEYFDMARRVLAAGGSKQLLARACGVTRQALNNWFNKGERDLADNTPSRWAGFVEYANVGLAAFEAEQIQKVRNPEWLLERRFPEAWGKKSQQDITVSQPAYDTNTEISKDDKEFLQNLAGGGAIDESEDTDQ